MDSYTANLFHNNVEIPAAEYDFFVSLYEDPELFAHHVTDMDDHNMLEGFVAFLKEATPYDDNHKNGLESFEEALREKGIEIPW